MIEHLITSNDKIIIEMDRAQIEFVAAVAHIFKYQHPDNATAVALIKTLVEQTNYVFSDPEKHGLNFKASLRPAATSQERWGYFVEERLDLSPLHHLLYEMDA